MPILPLQVLCYRRYFVAVVNPRTHEAEWKQELQPLLWLEFGKLGILKLDIDAVAQVLISSDQINMGRRERRGLGLGLIFISFASLHS